MPTKSNWVISAAIDEENAWEATLRQAGVVEAEERIESRTTMKTGMMST